MTEFFAYKQNGEIVSTGYCPEDQLENQKFDGALISKGKAIIGKQYFDNGNIFDIPAKPSQYHVFDYDKKKWIQDSQLAENEVKTIRNKLLFNSDWTQLPDVSIQTKQAWTEYRQALRDITTQPGYPFDIVWPQAPN